MSRLADKVALVTGAAQGIGSAIACQFSLEGATVIATDLTLESLRETSAAISQHASDSQTLVLDVTDASHWQSVAEGLKKRHGRLDILVNNAGIEMVQPIHKLSLEDWRMTYAVNVESIFLGAKICRELLAKAGEQNPAGAAIVNLSSVAGLVGIPDQMAYNSSKAAVRGLTKSLTVEFYHHGLNIRANSIHPGVIDTPMMQEAVANWRDTEKLGTRDLEDVLEYFRAICPQHKLGTPSDIALGAVYLASDEASFVTGTELVIDGGSLARW